MKPIEQRIAEELGVRMQQVAAAIELLDGGSTVPFIARYRKEVAGMPGEAPLRTLVDEHARKLLKFELFCLLRLPSLSFDISFEI